MEVLQGGVREYLQQEMERVGVHGYVQRLRGTDVKLVDRGVEVLIAKVVKFLDQMVDVGYASTWCQDTYCRNKPGHAKFMILPTATRYALPGAHSPPDFNYTGSRGVLTIPDNLSEESSRK